MRSATGCPHCARLVWTTDPAYPFCSCGHRADRARVFCDCATCSRPLPIDALRESVRRRVFVDGDDSVLT